MGNGSTNPELSGCGFAAKTILYMTDAPPVTWFMPVRNGMPYLLKTLESIRAQTYVNHRCLAWDNGSTDGTLACLRAYIPDKIAGEVISGHPLTLATSSAALVERATSDYLARIDADDIALPTRLAEQIGRMQADASLVVLGTRTELIDERDEPIDDEWELPIGDAEIRWRNRWQGSVLQPSLMYRRHAMLDAGNYREIAKAEDHDLWLRLGRLGRFDNLPQKLLRYRRHQSNTTVGVTDFLESNAVAATSNAAILFDGFEASEAIDVWEAAYPRISNRDIFPRHFAALRRAAVASARSAGEHDRYFMETTYYKRQCRFLLLNMARTALRLDQKQVESATNAFSRWRKAAK